MRVAVILCSATLALAATSTFAGAATRHARIARMVGTTRIATDCPVPSLMCRSWRLYPNARFTVTRLNAAGKPLARTMHFVQSDAAAHFHLRLRAGMYVLTAGPGRNVKLAKPHRVRVHAGTTKVVTVRFTAIPLMR
jgi:hypothetical protein